MCRPRRADGTGASLAERRLERLRQQISSGHAVCGCRCVLPCQSWLPEHPIHGEVQVLMACISSHSPVPAWGLACLLNPALVGDQLRCRAAEHIRLYVSKWECPASDVQILFIQGSLYPSFFFSRGQKRESWQHSRHEHRNNLQPPNIKCIPTQGVFKLSFT